MIEQENNQRLLKSRVQVPDKIEVDGAMRIPCHLYPDCKTVFIKALGWFSSKIFKGRHKPFFFKSLSERGGSDI